MAQGQILAFVKSEEKKKNELGAKALGSLSESGEDCGLCHVDRDQDLM